jgi:hypothetical protein
VAEQIWLVDKFSRLPRLLCVIKFEHLGKARHKAVFLYIPDDVHKAVIILELGSLTKRETSMVELKRSYH